MSELWIVVPNWEKFQHYKDRNPPWIKLYTDLAHRDEWRQLPLAARGLLATIWVEYALQRGQVRLSDVSSLSGTSHHRRALESLTNAGFLQLSASKPLALPARARALAKETEREASSEASLSTSRSEEATPKPPVPEAPASAVCPQCGLECKSKWRLAEHVENVHYEDPRRELVDELYAERVRAAIREMRH